MPIPEAPLPGKAKFYVNARKHIFLTAAFRLDVETHKLENTVYIKLAVLLFQFWTGALFES